MCKKGEGIVVPQLQPLARATQLACLFNR